MSKALLNLPFFLIFLAVFKNWFVSAEIIGGDWPYFFDQTLHDLSLFPPAWSSTHSNGLGGTIVAYFLDQYLYFIVFLFTNLLHIPWVIVYKIFWFGLFLALSIFSSIYFVRIILPELKLLHRLVGALIFTTNTYILMIVGGGQMGIALSYAIAPLVLARFIKLIDNFLLNENIKYPHFAAPSPKLWSVGDKASRGRQISNIKYAIIAALILAVQVMFDPRIAYITMGAILIYYLLSNIYNLLSWKVLSLLPPLLIAILLNAFWIVPVVFSQTSPLPEGFTSAEGFKFFSFADFSHALSLLHPNWPENIFGKVYFIRPEFLLLPVLAYSSLLFIKSKIQIKNQKYNNNLEIEQPSNKTILFFALLGLLGTFLAKGVNAPFGEVNGWIFQHIPGMTLFRDPTKFYSLVALSYSLLIPFSISCICNWLNSKLKIQNYLPHLFILFLTFYLLIIIRPAIFGQLGGTFKMHNVPSEYVELKDFLNNQNEFFRTLWVPKQQRFTFSSNQHPSIEASALFHATNSAEIVKKLQSKDSKKYLAELSIRYVIIPYDSMGELFLKDRKYSEKERVYLEKELDTIQWLKRQNIGKIIIYQTPLHKDRFWIEEGTVSYRFLSPTRYDLTVSTDRPTNLVFSENYSPYWEARIGKQKIKPIKISSGLNNFRLDKTGNYSMEIHSVQEQYYNYGRIVSIFALLGSTILLFMLKFKKQ